MNEIAGWIAPAATMIAAMMTAANLGARFTGWGFIVFTVGSIAWCMVALATDQSNLLWSNAFLTVVNLAGIWRWLGRQARFDDATEAERTAVQEADGVGLFKLSSLEGLPVAGRDGVTVAHVVDAMGACGSGKIRHLIVRTGGVAGVGETLRTLDCRDVRRIGDAVETELSGPEVERLPEVEAAA